MLSHQACEQFPIIGAQQHYWKEFRKYGRNSISTIAHYLEIKGALNEEAFTLAVNQTLHESDIFTAVLKEAAPKEARQPQQQMGMHRPQLVRVDLTQDKTPYQTAQKKMQQDIRQPLNILDPEMSVHLLFVLGPDHYLWYTRSHHILIDGYGMMLFEQRCCQLYSHLCRHTPKGRPFYAFRDYMNEEHQYTGSKRHQGDQQFWKDYLSASPDIPRLDPDYDMAGADILRLETRFSAKVSTGLRTSAELLGTGWPDLLVTLIALYLHQAGEKMLWLPFMNRWGSVAANIPGLMVNILPYQIDVDRSQTLGEYIRQAVKNLRTIYRHGRYRLERIEADQGLNQEESFFLTPFINILPFDVPVLPGCEVRHEVIARGAADGFNITCSSDPSANQMHFAFDSDRHSYPQEMLAHHATQLPAFLRRLTEVKASDEAGQRQSLQTILDTRIETLLNENRQ
ncbi:Dimodular nonribosomal peptide synthase [Vibrio aerogenes CECT 7868]|uniref:Dimodular nonribosomal peptide synthase n=1 Tax=Vibrio aerogenes CECT 7868 TaxID=1216006 RepID=A0A1M5XBM0_9VIBR|nr:condensation domain-containing protein [Vibrio aerogenes]SHH97220.1 Dimodular nonribosomal peptide synthase [Vibrio aerogenes CECT 7868]